MVKQTIIPYGITGLLVALGLLKLAWFTLLYVLPAILIVVVVGKLISDRVRYRGVSVSLKQ